MINKRNLLHAIDDIRQKCDIATLHTRHPQLGYGLSWGWRAVRDAPDAQGLLLKYAAPTRNGITGPKQYAHHSTWRNIALPVATLYHVGIDYSVSATTPQPHWERQFKVTQYDGDTFVEVPDHLAYIDSVTPYGEREYLGCVAGQFYYGTVIWWQQEDNLPGVAKLPLKCMLDVDSIVTGPPPAQTATNARDTTSAPWVTDIERRKRRARGVV